MRRRHRDLLYDLLRVHVDDVHHAIHVRRQEDALAERVIAGVERLIAVLAEAQPHASMQDFSFLAQTASPRVSHSKVRGDFSNGASDLHDLFLQAGFDLSSERGGKSGLASGRNAIRVFSWIVK